jgi:methionyl-tRNA formyltransferase
MPRRSPNSRLRVATSWSSRRTGSCFPRPCWRCPRYGCINIHASLLPRWRGAAPIQRAILAGDAETGVAIMRMDEGLDTGAILLEKKTPIRRKETAKELTERLAELGADAIVEALARLETLEPFPNHRRHRLRPKITKAEARIDWTRSAIEVDRKVRAFNPHLAPKRVSRARRLKIWRSRAVDGTGKPAAVAV